MQVSKKMVSLVIPAFNEEENIPLIYHKITELFRSKMPQYVYEIIFVDDGSRDNTWSIIVDMAKRDTQVKGRKFSRNFGHQIALSAAYDAAQGEAIISMDADLQDPPELLHEMIQEWVGGADIVYARRINRNDGLLKKLTATIYYRLLSHVSDVSIPRNVGDFRLVDAKVLQQLKSCREKSRYLRGMVAWTGFTCAYVDFERPNRHAGQTGYTWKKMVHLAFDGMTSFSTFPLKIVGYMGVMAIAAVHIVFFYMLYQMLMHDAHYQLAAWLSLAGFAMLGVQSFALWLLGEYVGRIYKESQARPLYIVEQECNLDDINKHHTIREFTHVQTSGTTRNTTIL